MKSGLYFFVVVLFFISCSEDESKNSDAKIENVNLISSNINGLEFADVVIDDEKNMVYLIPNIPIPEFSEYPKLEVDIQISNNATIAADTINVLKFVNADDFTMIVNGHDSLKHTW